MAPTASDFGGSIHLALSEEEGIESRGSRIYGGRDWGAPGCRRTRARLRAPLPPGPAGHGADGFPSVEREVGDVCAGGRVRDRVTIIQKKTGRPVQFEITEQTRTIDSRLASEDQRAEGKVSLPLARLACSTRFVADSPLEGDGFEPSVPRRDSIFRDCPVHDRPLRHRTSLRLQRTCTTGLSTMKPATTRHTPANTVRCNDCCPPTPRRV
jgi:hypothetical protein